MAKEKTPLQEFIEIQNMLEEMDKHRLIQRAASVKVRHYGQKIPERIRGLKLR